MARLIRASATAHRRARVLTSVLAATLGLVPFAIPRAADAQTETRAMTTPAAPTGFTAMVGNAQVTLGWDAPASGSGVTRHEYRYKTTGSYPATWTRITNSGVGGANQAGFTVTGLTNEVAHTFELRAANASGEGAAAQAGPVTPTPGICDRTQQVQDEILDELASVSDCAAVTVANLATITDTLDFTRDGLTSLQEGDFAGLTEMRGLDLTSNSLSLLPDGVFSGLRSLQTLDLPDNDLSLLPDGVFSGLTALKWLYLNDNELGSLPDGVFAGLTALRTLDLTSNSLSLLPDGVFSGLTSLSNLNLADNDLSLLPDGVFSGLTALKWLYLHDNDLSLLPDGVFSGLTSLRRLDLFANPSLGPLPGDVFSGLTNLGRLALGFTGLETLPAGMFSGLTELWQLNLNGNRLTELPAGVFSGLSQLVELELGFNSADPMPLAVTVEKVGTDQVRAKVLAGAPFAVDIPVTVANGALVGGAAELGVAAGSVESNSVTVTRTAGTTAAVTADVDLTTPPSLPERHGGYVFARASSGLPAEILPAVPTITDVAITSTPVLATDTYGFGETIRITVTFSEAVVVTGDPVLTFELGNSGAAREVDAAYESGTGTAALVFAYTVLATDVDDDGIVRVADALMLETGEAIASAVGVDADLEHAGGSVSESGHKVDGSRSVARVAVSSKPVLETDTYGRGETIRFTVTFNAEVDVTGDPVLTFELGNSGAAREVDAAYESGSGTATLVFGYPVVSTDVDDNGISLLDGTDFPTRDSPVGLDSDDSITFTGTGTDAPLAYPGGRGTQSGHKVDGSRKTGNNAPEFSAATATREVPENSAPDIAVGTVVTATDADNDTLTYNLEETDDHESFAIDSSSGQIQTVSGVTYDHEAAQNSYSVTVRADDGNGGTDTIDVTVNVTDVDEQPDKTAKPMVTAASASSLSVTWSAPDNAGPEITDYDYRYRTSSPRGEWMEVTNTTITGLSATIGSLEENTSYDVQVRATNAEGMSGWSASGSGRTAANANTAPSFTSSATFGVEENRTAAGTVRAEDSDAGDAVTGYAITGGADRGFFSIGPATGALTFDDVPNFEDAQDQGGGNTYEVTVQATSGTGAREKTATQTITVTVTDDDEAPDAPDAPNVSSASVSSLSVTWPAPDNDGPAIDDYDVRYRVGTSGDWTAKSHTGITTTATLTSLSENTSYQVQVRATNDEGTSGWSPSGSGRTRGGGICDRTPRIRDRIVVLLKYRHSYKGDCSGVTGEHLAKLKSLDLGRNPSTESAFTITLQRQDFGGLSNLEKLYMRDTGLRSLPAGVFDGLTNLEELELDRNRLRSLPSEVFSDLRSLQRLELQKNPSLQSLPYDEFEALPKLRELMVDPEGRRKLQVAGGEGDASLTVAAGSTATYQVRLMHRPSYSNTEQPTVTVSSDNAGVTPTPTSLRFTKENWFRRQTVTVRAAASAAGTTARLDHKTTAITLDRPPPGVTVRVPQSDQSGDAAPVTAEFEGLPQGGHDGETAFSFRIAFSEDVATSADEMRDHAFETTGGAVRKAKRQQKGSNRMWEMTVKPNSGGAVTIRLPETTDCDADGAICARDGRPLSHSLSATVRGPAGSSAIPAPMEEDRAARLCSALAGGDDVNQAAVAAALWEDGDMSDDRLAALDSLGNGNGRYDLGDLLSWIARCRRTVPDPPAAAGSVTRRSGWLRPALLVAVTSAWGCGLGDGGVAPHDDAARDGRTNAAVVDPGPLHVRLTAPPQARDIGAMLVVEGPAIDSLQAPGLELFERDASSPTRREVIIAGALPGDGPLLRVWVPHRGDDARYRVRLLQVAGEDFTLRDLTVYGTVIFR